MTDISKTDDFQSKVQELAAAFVLATPGDLSTFGPIFQSLDYLDSHPEVGERSHLRKALSELRGLVEEAIMGQISWEEAMPKVEMALQVLTSKGQLLDTEKEDGLGGDTQQESPSQNQGAPSAQTSSGSDYISDPELLREFLVEARENLESIEVEIIALEEDPSNLEAVHRIFRPFHTIKGVSGFLNLQDVHTLAHRVEDVLDRARNRQMIITQDVIDLVLEAVDILKAMLASIQRRMEGQEGEDHSKKLEDFLERLSDLTESKTCEEGEEVPLVGEILTATQRVAPEDVAEALQIQRTVSPEKPLGEILVEQKKVERKDVEKALKIQDAIQQTSAEEPRSGGLSGTIRVDMFKLDNLVDMVGELVIAQSLIRQNPRIQEIMDHRLAKDFGHLGRITSELQRTAMSMRMVPIKNTFQKMIRLVRDLSRKSGKPVQLVMSGETTEIDRNMVDAIHDPLVHMIRNSVDHGIEPPEVRRERGKPPVATVHLRAYHKGGHVIIEIQDDGGGLDREKILRKAREKGLVRENEELSDHEIDQLIFQPGFSTADQVTDVSGRGVGMDVVKRAIEKLRGRIEINSQKGVGCTVTIKLPLTLAIIDGMVVRVGAERYIIPTMNIRETFQPSEGSVSTVHGRGEMIRVRDRLLPLVRLHRVFGIPTARTRPSEALGIVVENEGDLRCLLVDQVLGKQEVVIKSLGEKLMQLPGVSGGAILGDGRVALILDVAGLLSLETQSRKTGVEIN